MFVVESYAAVRRFVFVEGQSRREAARVSSAAMPQCSYGFSENAEITN